MRSAQPKVLHRVAGRPMLDCVLAALEQAGVSSHCVVLSADLAGFEPFLAAHPDLCVAIQKNRLGTGDAVAAAAWSFTGVRPAPYAAGQAWRGAQIQSEIVVVCAGDVPAVQPEVLRAFIETVRSSNAALGVLGMRLAEPQGYGRLVTQGEQLTAIVEEKDADAATRRIDVCNTGIYAARTEALFDLLHGLRPDNAQREYYLTDCVKLACERGLATLAVVAGDHRDFAGVNDRVQLAEIEAWLVGRKIRQLMAQGVSFRLPGTTYVELAVEAGTDCEVGPGARLCGETRLGDGCQVGAGVTLDDAKVGDGAVIGDGSFIRNCSINSGERVLPLSVRIG